jgi:hypothetical protein
LNKYRKQHILPKAYLKYFSKDNSGKGIYVLRLSSQSRKAEIKNQGDSIFWKKDFYTENRFEDKYIIEKSFGIVESKYHNIIDSLNKRESLIGQEVRFGLIWWIALSKIRSPRIRDNYERKVKFINNITEILPSSINTQYQQVNEQFSKLAKKYHLDYFFDNNLFIKTFTEIASCLMTKQWIILVAPETIKFWTSDNPGFSIYSDEYEKKGIIMPDPSLSKLTIDSHHFYPLTKDYCLECAPHEKGSTIKTNLNDEIVSYKHINSATCAAVNKNTALTADDLIITDIED